MNDLEQEAKAYIQKKKKKLSAAQQSKLRVYMSSALSGLLASGRVRRPEEAIRESYNWAVLCIEFEDDNF